MEPKMPNNGAESQNRDYDIELELERLATEFNDKIDWESVDRNIDRYNELLDNFFKEREEEENSPAYKDSLKRFNDFFGIRDWDELYSQKEVYRDPEGYYEIIELTQKETQKRKIFIRHFNGKEEEIGFNKHEW